MPKMTRLLGILVAAVVLSATGWLYHRGQLRQQATLRQLAITEKRVAANNEIANQEAHSIIHGIQFSTLQNEKQTRDIVVMRDAERIGHRTQTLTDTLRTLRRQLEATTNITKRTNVASTTLLTDKKLVKAVERYLAFIQKFSPHASLTPTSFSDLVDKVDGVTEELTNGLPLGVELAIYTQLEAQLHLLSRMVLIQEAVQVPSCCFCFTRTRLLSVPASDTVAPEAIYNAQLFLGQAANDLDVTDITATLADGRIVQAQLDGPQQGAIEFQVPAAQANQPDTVRAQWQGMIKVHSYPHDTVWQLTVPYFIVKTATP